MQFDLKGLKDKLKKRLLSRMTPTPSARNSDFHSKMHKIPILPLKAVCKPRLKSWMICMTKRSWSTTRIIRIKRHNSILPPPNGISCVASWSKLPLPMKCYFEWRMVDRAQRGTCSGSGSGRETRPRATIPPIQGQKRRPPQAANSRLGE
jgi:hypothetical protein